jgi:hypothetical protein
MNARSFRINVALVITAYALALAVLATLAYLKHQAYMPFKDAVPLVIAIPAAWLGFCLQRRQAYLKDVRDLWTKLVAGVQDAIQYTHLSSPPQAEYAKVLKSLSAVTEELRSVFCNVGESQGKVGLYPFERIKTIHAVVSRLGFGEAFTAESAREARAAIVANWKKLRVYYLGELERGIPANPDSPYLK